LPTHPLWQRPTEKLGTSGDSRVASMNSKIKSYITLRVSTFDTLGIGIKKEHLI